MAIFCFINNPAALPPSSPNWQCYSTLLQFVASGLDAGMEDNNNILVIEDMFTNDGTYKHTKFYGIQLIETIRVKYHLKNRIVLLSPTPESMLLDFQKRHKLFTPLLDAAVAILPSTATVAEIEAVASNMLPLTDAGLEDARLSLYALPGFFNDRLLHDWKLGMSQDDYTIALNKLLPYLNSQQQETVVAKNYPFQLFSIADINDFFIQRSSILSEIAFLLTGDTINNSNNHQTNLKLLLVEDDTTQLEQIKDILGKRFIVESHTTSNTAIAALRADTANNIVAVIADWRLLVPGTAKRQNAQGYDVLQAAALTGIRALHALTSLDDNQLVHGIRNKMDCKITFIQKHYFFNDTLLQANYLNDIEAGCIDAITQTFPTSKAWKKNGLHQKYIEQRMSVNWLPFLKRMEDAFSTISAEILAARKINITYTPITNYGGPPLSEKDLYAVLLYRRFYLWFNKLLATEYTDDTERTDAIFFCLRNAYGNRKNAEEKSVNTENLKSFFINQLCIKSKDLLGNLLPEEKVWYHSLKT